MKRRIHMSLDIEGGIQNAKSLCGAINVDGRTLKTEQEVKAFLREQQVMGRRVLPMGDCGNFDDQTGCRGHLVGEPRPEPAPPAWREHLLRRFERAE